MNFLRSMFGSLRRVPLLRRAAYAVVRLGRNLFWSFRPAYMAGSTALPTDYLTLVAQEISSSLPEFTLVEVGCGDGRVLRSLAGQYPQAHFVGVDLQRTAIDHGNRSVSASDRAADKFKLICGSCLDDSISLQCDYLISRTALIYLDSREIKTFLAKRLPQIGRRAILQEIVSTTGQTERSHFFAHPLAALVEEIAPGQFDVHQEILAYPPWKGDKWTGANIVIARKGA